MIAFYATITGPNFDTINVNKRSILSVSSKSSDRSDNKLPSFGLISNSSTLSFIDINDNILRLSNEKKLGGRISVTVFITNTLVKYSQSAIVSGYANNWRYDPKSKTVTVDIKDVLEDWQEINFSNKNLHIFDPLNPTEITLLDFYNELVENTPDAWITFEELDERTRKFYESYHIKALPIVENNLWHCWQMFCEVAQSHLYVNNQGNAVVKYNGGN